MSLHSPCYSARVETGFYDSLATQLNGMDICLARTELDKHIRRNITDIGHYNYLNTDDNSEYEGVVFGEICTAASGTKLSAKGNYFTGGTNEPIKPMTDQSRPVYDALVLKSPTLATELLNDLFLNQVDLLDTIKVADETFEMEQKQQWKKTTEWISESNKDSNNPDLITILIGPKYKLPPVSETHITPSKRTTRRNVSNTSSMAIDSTSNPSSSSAQTLPQPDIRLGALYDPHHLPDYGGPTFAHQHAKLVQHDIRDADDKYIAPWDMYSACRPGSLILANVTLHCWKMTASDRKAYQIRVKTMSVLSTSDEEIKPRSTPSAPASAENPSSKRKLVKLELPSLTSKPSKTSQKKPKIKND